MEWSRGLVQRIGLGILVDFGACAIGYTGLDDTLNESVQIRLKEKKKGIEKSVSLIKQ